MTTEDLSSAPEPLRQAVASGRVGSVVRIARRAAGLTQCELGDRCGYGQSTISRIEDGKTANPSPAILRRIAEVTGIPTEWLGLASLSAPRFTRAGRPAPAPTTTDDEEDALELAGEPQPAMSAPRP